MNNKNKFVGEFTKQVYKPKWIKVSDDEHMLVYKNNKYFLRKQGQGVYSIGKAYLLYHLPSGSHIPVYIKVIGWVKSDNHSPDFLGSYLKGIVTEEECKKATIKYIDLLLT